MDANLLKAKMMEIGKNQGEVAHAIGISVNSMSRKLTGKRDFKLSEVEKLCDYLCIADPGPIFLKKSSQICNK